jgi:hypothetical protein
VGARAVLVLTGHGAEHATRPDLPPCLIAEDMEQAAELILAAEGGS